jgi:hypothetical protein
MAYHGVSAGAGPNGRGARGSAAPMLRSAGPLASWARLAAPLSLLLAVCLCCALGSVGLALPASAVLVCLAAQFGLVLASGSLMVRSALRQAVPVLIAGLTGVVMGQLVQSVGLLPVLGAVAATFAVMVALAVLVVWTRRDFGDIGRLLGPAILVLAVLSLANGPLGLRLPPGAVEALATGLMAGLFLQTASNVAWSGVRRPALAQATAALIDAIAFSSGLLFVLSAVQAA